MGDQDNSIWNSDGRAKFETDMTTCDEKCFFDSRCTETKIREIRHYSEDCSSAFGEYATCTAEHCWMWCRPFENEVCHNSKKEHCDRHFYEETGFKSDALPKNK